MLNSIVLVICFLISGELAVDVTKTKDKHLVDKCVAAIGTNDNILDSYDLKDDVLIPDSRLVRPLQLKSQEYCDKVMGIMTEVESSRVCEKSERNKKLFAEFRERGYQKKKVFCERSTFLLTLHKCWPKTVQIRDNMEKKISKFKVSNEESFRRICW